MPAAEWTLASVLKKAYYKTYFAGKWHLGEDDYAMPIAQGFDKMQNVVLYHLNAYTYAFESWNRDMTPGALILLKTTSISFPLNNLKVNLQCEVIMVML